MPRERILPPQKNLVSPGKIEEESSLRPPASQQDKPPTKARRLPLHNRTTSPPASTQQYDESNPKQHDAASPGAEPTGTNGATIGRDAAQERPDAETYEDAPPEPCEVSMRPAPPSPPPLGKPEAEEVAAGTNNPPAARAGARALTNPSTMPLTSGAEAGEEAACG